MDLVTIIVGAIVVILAIIIIYLFNRLIVLRNRIDNAWSQIDVQLKKRADLVPNLVETVKGYAKHEKSVFENVTKARAATTKAGSVEDKANANNMLTGALKTLFAVAENYPQLKANENFRLLQEQLDGIESKIAYSRQFYNDSVLQHNNAVEMFPSNIVAKMIGYKERPYFEIEEASRKAVKVAF